MAESLSITIITTVEESPWSNRLINFVLSKILDKILEDTKCHPDLAISRWINTKNSLYSIHGFYTNQLVIGKNKKLPSTLNEKIPALTCQPVSKIVSSNLDTIHRARQAFIASKNSEKIRRALSDNIRISGGVKYITGDSVYYKRMHSREWHGPAKVLGQTANKCSSKKEALILESTLVAFNSLTKTAKTTKLYQLNLASQRKMMNMILNHTTTSVRTNFI